MGFEIPTMEKSTAFFPFEETTRKSELEADPLVTPKKS